MRIRHALKLALSAYCDVYMYMYMYMYIYIYVCVCWVVFGWVGAYLVLL